jgi:hypothetical protein
MLTSIGHVGEEGDPEAIEDHGYEEEAEGDPLMDAADHLQSPKTWHDLP